MWRYVVKKIIQMFVVLAIVSMIVFLMINQLGDPVLLLLPQDATQEEVEALSRSLGLDKPPVEQYIIFVANLFRGDLGTSFRYKQPALQLILERMPATLEIVILAMLIGALFAIPLGVYVGANPKTFLSRFVLSGSLIGISMPTFWFGILLIFFFSVHLGILPSSGRGEVVVIWGMRLSFLTLDGLKHIILPALTLAVQQIATQLRLTRAGIMEGCDRTISNSRKPKGSVIEVFYSVML